MLVFAASNNGGAGRTVTTANLAYQSALAGRDVCFLDFDFGSPTAGLVFGIDPGKLDPEAGGLQSFLLGRVDQPHRYDVFAATERRDLSERSPAAGRLVLLPGDRAGGEFTTFDRAGGERVRQRCVDLFLRLHEEFEVVFVDLSAGRSYALELALVASAARAEWTTRWLVFHRWTRQHVIAAADLVHGVHGIVATGGVRGHDRDHLLGSLRFVRTAVADPAALRLTAEQTVWVSESDRELTALARDWGAGAVSLLGAVPFDPVLQWREQLITDHDHAVRRVANRATLDAFAELAARLVDNDQ
jgi:hypothetical protein